MKLKKLFFAATFAMAAVCSFANINVTFTNDPVGGFYHYEYAETAEPQTSDYKSIDLGFASTGFSVEYEFKDIGGFYPYAGIFLGYSAFSQNAAFGISGGFFKPLINTKLYDIELQADMKLLVSPFFETTIKPSANIAFMDHSRKGWYVLAGIEVPFYFDTMPYCYADEPDITYEHKEYMAGAFVNFGIGYKF